MKKLLLSALIFVGICFADQEGVIEAIDFENKTITVAGMQIKVLPNTQIEEDSCWLLWDVSRRFIDLKVGDIIELDIAYSNNMPIATKIEIQCVRNRAY